MRFPPNSEMAANYFHLTKKRKAILQCLVAIGKKYKGLIFPRVEFIAHCCNCSSRCVQKFFEWNAKHDNYFFTIIRQKRPNGSHDVNVYKLSDKFIFTFAWLQKRGLHNATGYQIEKALISIGKHESSPPSPNRSSPPYTDSSLQGYLNTIVPSNFLLKDIEIPLESKIYLSKTFSEAVLVETINCYWYARRKNLIKKSPQAYMIGVAKRLKEKMIL